MDDPTLEAMVNDDYRAAFSARVRHTRCGALLTTATPTARKDHGHTPHTLEPAPVETPLGDALLCDRCTGQHRLVLVDLEQLATDLDERWSARSRSITLRV